MLRKMIRFVSVRASEVASKSVPVSSFTPAAEVLTDPEASTIKQQLLNEQLKEMVPAVSDDEW
jgi:hypothetical protein